MRKLQLSIYLLYTVYTMHCIMMNCTYILQVMPRNGIRGAMSEMAHLVVLGWSLFAVFFLLWQLKNDFLVTICFAGTEWKHTVIICFSTSPWPRAWDCGWHGDCSGHPAIDCVLYIQVGIQTYIPLGLQQGSLINDWLFSFQTGQTSCKHHLGHNQGCGWQNSAQETASD